MRLFGWVWVLFWWFLQFQLLFAGSFPAFGLGLGAVLGISAVSATFSRLFSGFLAGFGKLIWGFLQFQLLFLGSFPALRLGFWSCFGDFCSFSYFLPDLFRLLGWVLGAVLGISAVSATFCEASGIMVEAQQHIEKPLVSFNVLTAKKNTKGVFTSGFS